MARCWTEDAGPAWVAERQRLDERLLPLTRVLVDALELEAGEHVLDVGCGVGGSSLELARAVGSGGHVLAVDISASMLDAARTRPAEESASPITWLEADAQTHAFEPGAFDAVASRFGVMFFDDPIRAFANLRLALRDGGRFVFLCWQEPRANPWFFAGVDELRDLLDFPEAPTPNSPGPFGLADANRTHALLDGAGFSAVEIDAVSVEMPFSGTVGDMVEHMLTIGPVGEAIREVEDQGGAADEARARLVEVVESMAADQGLANTGAAWLVRALP